MCKATSGIYAFIQHVEASYNHVSQTCVALKGYHMEMTNSGIWIRLSATLSPLQGPFPVYVTGMSHFSDMPYTVVETMNFDWASCIHHLCEAMAISHARRHSNVLQNTGGDQSMEKNKGKATYSAYAFTHLAIEGKTV